MITQKYKLNLIPDKVPVIVNCSQFDALSRTISFDIYDGNYLFEIPSGTTATVRGTKSDNTGFEYPCEIDGSNVSFAIKDQMTVFDGRVPCEIRLAGSDGIIGTCNFLLNVEKTPLDPNVTISETDLPLLEEAEQNAIRAEQAAEEAVQVLSTAVKSVNDILPDTNGNVDVDAVYSVNNVSPDSSGNVDVVALPTGGTADQVLVKQSSADGDADWETAGMWHGDEVGSLPVPINADQLQGHEASYFQEKLTAGDGIDITNNVISNSELYNAGDVFHPTDNRMILLGTIGSSGTNLQFNIPLEKPIANDVTSATFTALTFQAFSSNGRFETNINVITNASYSVTASVDATRSFIYAVITKTSSYNATVLTPIVVFLSSCSISFS